MILTCTTILILSQVCRKFKTDRQKSNLPTFHLCCDLSMQPLPRCGDFCPRGANSARVITTIVCLCVCLCVCVCVCHTPVLHQNG